MFNADFPAHPGHLIVGQGITLIDRLLDTQPGCRATLAGHAGAVIRLAFPLLALDIALLEGGRLGVAEPDALPTATVTLTPAVLLDLILQRPDALAAATLEGDVALGRALLAALEAFDLAQALQPLLGDILAARADAVLRGGRDWRRQAVDALAANTAEYLVHEKQILAAAARVRQFCRQVDSLREAADRTAARIALLESRVAR